MILFYDTETTGLVQSKLPAESPAQPHLVQLALLLTNDAGQELQSASVIIKPDGYIIPPEIAKIHGIPHEMAVQMGVPLSYGVGLFLHWGNAARVSVAHNIEFDRKIMQSALIRTGRKPTLPFPPEEFCTMNAATAVVNLPPTAKMKAAGYNKPKNPNLTECIKFFFKEDFEGAHNAMNDVRGCARVYFELKARGHVK